MCVVQRGLKVSNHTGKLCVSWGLAVGSMGTVGMENSVYCHFFFFLALLLHKCHHESAVAQGSFLFCLYAQYAVSTGLRFWAEHSSSKTSFHLSELSDPGVCYNLFSYGTPYLCKWVLPVKYERNYKMLHRCSFINSPDCDQSVVLPSKHSSQWCVLQHALWS